MSVPNDNEAAIRWFLETVFRLREDLSDAEFDAFRQWVEFVADEQATAH